MSNNTMVKVVVDAKSKFGILNKLDGKWLNTQDAAALAAFKIGYSYDVELASVQKGDKTFLNIVKGTETGAPDPAAAKKPFVKRDFNKGRDFDKEARGKTACAMIEAALQSPHVTIYSKPEQVFAWVDSVVEYGMKKVFGK